MSPQPITSVRNPAVVAAARLHRSRHRRDEGRTILEGPQVIEEAVAAGVSIRELYGLDDEVSRLMAPTADVELQIVSPQVLARIAGTETPRGPIAVIDIPEDRIAVGSPVLVTWGVGDPGNCGTLIRSAAAFGFGYVSGPNSADPWSPKVLRSGAGGHFGTEIGRIQGLEDLDGRTLVGTVPDGGGVPGALEQTAAVLVGSEAHGLPPEVVAACDRLVSITMPGGAESLNAAVAGSIVAYLGATTTQS